MPWEHCRIVQKKKMRIHLFSFEFCPSMRRFFAAKAFCTHITRRKHIATVCQLSKWTIFFFRFSSHGMHIIALRKFINIRHWWCITQLKFVSRYLWTAFVWVCTEQAADAVHRHKYLRKWTLSGTLQVGNETNAFEGFPNTCVRVS